MNPGQMWMFHGNLKRIVEMDAAGVGANAIAGVFQDNNIDINANDVCSMLKANEVLTKKPFQKLKLKSSSNKMTLVVFNQLKVKKCLGMPKHFIA